MSRRRSMEAIEASEFVSIGELIRLTGYRYSTLKYYTEEGILPFQQAEQNLTRRYPKAAAIQRLEEIMYLKQQGLRIDEIKKRLS